LFWNHVAKALACYLIKKQSVVEQVKKNTIQDLIRHIINHVFAAKKYVHEMSVGEIEWWSGWFWQYVKRWNKKWEYS